MKESNPLLSGVGRAFYQSTNPPNSGIGGWLVVSIAMPVKAPSVFKTAPGAALVNHPVVETGRLALPKAPRLRRQAVLFATSPRLGLVRARGLEPLLSRLSFWRLLPLRCARILVARTGADPVPPPREGGIRTRWTSGRRLAAGVGIEPTAAGFKGPPARLSPRIGMEADVGPAPPSPGSEPGALAGVRVRHGAPRLGLNRRRPGTGRLLCHRAMGANWGDARVSRPSMTGSQPAPFACRVAPPWSTPSELNRALRALQARASPIGLRRNWHQRKELNPHPEFWRFR